MPDLEATVIKGTGITSFDFRSWVAAASLCFQWILSAVSQREVLCLRIRDLWPGHDACCGFLPKAGGMRTKRGL